MSPTVTAERAAAGSAGAYAAAVLARHEARAADLGQELGEVVGDPTAFAAKLHAAFRELADPEYRDGQQWVAP